MAFNILASKFEVLEKTFPQPPAFGQFKAKSSTKRLAASPLLTPPEGVALLGLLLIVTVKVLKTLRPKFAPRPKILIL
jgi:hypothetical protein